MRCVVPLALYRLIEPSLPTLTIAMFGTVCPDLGLRFEAFGRSSPVGHAVMNVLPVGPVAVMLTATDPMPDSGSP